ncbi:MAG: N-acetylglucosamine-6-phosphate deacetylase [Pseudomonadota bacterium]
MILESIDILDGAGLCRAQTVTIDGGRISAIEPSATEGPLRAIIAPSLVDLQVNGGGGVMLNEAQNTSDINQIRAAHARLGSGHILPKLISDSRETTARVIELIAQTEGLGLHLEGPHLAIPGAHDPTHLRPLESCDIAFYAEAAETLPHLMITLAPEQTRPGQIAALAEAGILVSLGHTDCSAGQAREAFDEGARMVTHLFNAMSGLHHRAPGLVGATLDPDCETPFGLIADGHHVADAALRITLAAGRERLVVVSDAMALTGSEADQFLFQGRQIQSDGTRLSLPDGTLAGARASLLDGLRHLARIANMPLADLLPTGFDHPWRLLGRGTRRIEVGAPTDLLRLNPDNSVDTLIDGQWRSC